MQKESESLIRTEIWHRAFNLRTKHTIDELPHQKVVFAIFAIIDDEPKNCRYVGECEDLHQTIINLFEQTSSPGLTKFMQGPWIKMLVYEKATSFTVIERQVVAQEWRNRYQPAIDDNGECPGYYA